MALARIAAHEGRDQEAWRLYRRVPPGDPDAEAALRESAFILARQGEYRWCARLVEQLPTLHRFDAEAAELRLWQEAGLDPSTSSGTWYREVGRGMGATLNTASAMGAYTLSDRGTWLSFQNRGDLEIVFEGDPGLENPYGVIVVSPERHAHVKAQAAQQLVDWFVSDAGQGAIDAFQLGGEQLFFSRARASSVAPRP